MNKKITKNNMWGMATAIDLHNCNSKTIRNKEKIKQFVEELVKLIGMKTFGETQVVHFGEDEKVAGFSMIQLIETSLISGHFANLTNNVYLDVFSCKAYDPEVVGEFTKKFFEAKDYNLKTIYRK
jgi:S-adenosylmethionine/arginine decarboxylase-like enzyme